MKDKQTFTPLHRLLHWTLAISVSGVFLTGFLRLYWMNKDKVVGIISGTSDLLSKDEMVGIAKNIQVSMWQWHIIFAYIIVGAFIIRIIYMLIKGIRFPDPFNKQLSFIERFQGGIYILFYLFVAFNIFSGSYHMWMPKSEFRTAITMIHKWAVYWFPIFLILHLGGVYLAEKSSHKGISSKMIGGE